MVSNYVGTYLRVRPVENGSQGGEGEVRSLTTAVEDENGRVRQGSRCWDAASLRVLARLRRTLDPPSQSETFVFETPAALLGPYHHRTEMSTTTGWRAWTIVPAGGDVETM